MGKGIRQNRFVTLGKELALKDGCMGCLIALDFVLRIGVRKDSDFLDENL